MQINWTIFKGMSKSKEDFRRALLRVFLVRTDMVEQPPLDDMYPVFNQAEYADYVLHPSAEAYADTLPMNIVSVENGTIKIDIPQSVMAQLPVGVYSLKAVWFKNKQFLHDATHVGVADKSYSIVQNKFAITDVLAEATNPEIDNPVLNVQSGIATYGYNGLDSYEEAVLNGETLLSRGLWIANLSEMNSRFNEIQLEWDNDDEEEPGLKQQIEAEITDVEERMDNVEERADDDHARAESDHQTATGDHETASDDHETASSDHTLAEADHDTSVQSTAIQYAEGDDDTTAPVIGWQNTVPTVEGGKYLWSRTTFTYGDGSTRVVYGVSLMPTVTVTENSTDGGVDINLSGAPLPNGNVAKQSEFASLRDYVAAGNASVTASVNKTIQETGSATAITVSGSVSGMPAGISPTKMQIHDGTSVIKEQTGVTSISASNVAISATTTYAVKAWFGSAVKTKSVTSSVVSPSFIGAGMAYSDVTSGTHRLLTSVAGTYSVTTTTNGQKIFFVYPASIGNITGAKFNGFDFPFTSDSPQTKTVGGVSYKVYESANTYPSGTVLNIVVTA